jgi:hypothetical protein
VATGVDVASATDVDNGDSNEDGVWSGDSVGCAGGTTGLHAVTKRLSRSQLNANANFFNDISSLEQRARCGPGAGITSGQPLA